MNDLLKIEILPLLLTLGAYQIGLVCQRRWKSPVFNPILIAVVIILAFLSLTGLELADYQASTARISWLVTPATISLAIPMYEQFGILRRNLKAVVLGVGVGAVSSLVMVFAFCAAVGFDAPLTISLLPKSVTSAIGVPLSELSGGISAITTPVIIITGIISGSLCSPLCRIFRLGDPISQGTALGTSGHVIGTAKANELGALTGAVSSLSLVTSGLITSALFPIIVSLLP